MTKNWLNPHLESLAPYQPGKPIPEALRGSFTKLASNENPLGPSPLAIAALAAAAPDLTRLYPDGDGAELKRKLAGLLGASPAELVLGNGSDEITFFLALAYLSPGRSLVTSEYAFIRYRMAAQLVNAEARLAPMKNYRHDPEALAALVDDTTALLCIDNPCNPTGGMMTADEVEWLLKNVPPQVNVLLDEAYYDYAKGDPAYPDSLKLRASYPNLIITRTFSKAYGLAGLRIGYGLARPEVIRDIDRVRPPFNTNYFGQIAATAALDDAAHIRASVENNESGRLRLEAAFTELGLPFVASHANFILVDATGRCESGVDLCARVEGSGVGLRPVAPYGLRDHFRVTIGTPAENEKFIAGLKSALR